jgi:hypothetical protein
MADLTHSSAGIPRPLTQAARRNIGFGDARCGMVEEHEAAYYWKTDPIRSSGLIRTAS